MRRTSAPKRVSAREAVRALPPRSRVLLPPACAATLSLLEALHEERGRFEDLHLYTGLMFAEPAVLQDIGQNIKLTTWHVAGPTQKLADEGRIDYLPLRLSQVPATFAKGGPIPADAVFIQCSPPDEHGYVSLGVGVSTTIDVARQASLVVAEINRQTPRTLGNSMLHVSEIDYAVDADYPLVQHRQAQIGEMERTIAGHVAALIPDGATIQMGIGAIPEALMFLLDDKKDLGVHSGMISDGFVPLIEKGVITGARKSLDRYKVVTGEVMGGPELYQFVHNNPLIHCDSVLYTHNPLVVRQHERFVSINSAVEIDLTGQVNSETVGGRQISGLGGQFDFIEGVLHSKDGVSIFAMPSTAARGKVSRIVAKLAPGAAVSTPRYCTDVVVTEYGVAALKGKTLRQRAEALIAIAHPSFRAELERSLAKGGA
jgi:4-hydroxybutyrate CoA-transferase